MRADRADDALVLRPAESNSTYLSVRDEGFFDLGDTSWGKRSGFRQSRAFAGAGLCLDEAPWHVLEIGYLNQWVDRTTVDAENHVPSILLLLNS